MIQWTAFCQKSDSTRLVPVEKWKLERLLQAYFYTIPVYDSAFKHYNKSLIAADSTIKAAKRLIEIRTEERDLKVMEVKALKEKQDIDHSIYIEQNKAQRKKGRKEGFIAGGGSVLLLLIIFL